LELGGLQIMLTEKRVKSRSAHADFRSGTADGATVSLQRRDNRPTLNVIACFLAPVHATARVQLG
jgi:hypothetical protein